MDWNARYSGGNLSSGEADRPSPVVLRLLAAVHHPPASVVVPGAGAGHEVRALDARGYRVVASGLRGDEPGAERPPVDFLDADLHGAFDLVCEVGLYSAIPLQARDRYVQAAARALRSGGKLFGAFLDGEGGEGPPYPTSVSDLIHRFSPHFEVERLDRSAFTAASGSPQIEAILVRR